jgi:hypothetical protein
MPVAFSDITNLSGLVAGTQYFIQSINAVPTTLITLSATLGGAVKSDLGAGTPTAAPMSYQAIPLQNPTPAYSATANGTTTLTANTTAGLVPGMPVIFATTFGGLTGGTTYYVLTVASATTFTITATVFSPSALTVTGSSTSAMTVPYTSQNLVISGYSGATLTTSASTHNLSVGNPVVFGPGIGGIVPGVTYYVAVVGAANTFQVAATPITTPITPTGSGTNIPCTAFTSTLVGTQTITPIANSASILTSAVYGLTPGMSVAFSVPPGGLLVAPTSYYIVGTPTPTAFQVSLTMGGPPIILTSVSGASSIMSIAAVPWPPPAVRILQPVLLGGLTSSLSAPVGAGNSLTFTVYRTPALTNISGIVGLASMAPTSFVAAYTLSDFQTMSSSYFDSSLSLAAGDRISVFAQANGSIGARDIGVQLLML